MELQAQYKNEMIKVTKPVPKRPITKSDKLRAHVKKIISESMKQVVEGVKLDQKYENVIMNKDEYNKFFNLSQINIIPKKDTTLKEMRESEKKLVSDYGSKNTSFLFMFKNRMAKLKGKRKRVSVTVDFKINTDNYHNDEIDDDYDEQRIKYRKFNDEYGVSNIKVKRQTRRGYFKEKNSVLL